MPEIAEALNHIGSGLGWIAFAIIINAFISAVKL